MNGLTLRINGGGSGKAKNTSFGVLAISFPLEYVQKYGENNNLTEFFTCSTADDQLAKLKTILSNDKGGFNQSVVEFLATVFLWAPAKHPVKCFLTRHITKCKHLQPAFASSLSAAILALTGSTGRFTHYADATSKLLTCIENFPTAAEALKRVEVQVADCMVRGLGCCVSTLSDTSTLSPTEKNEIFTLSHSALRILLFIVQKVSEANKAELISMFNVIRASIEYLLFDEDVPMDSKSVCGILLLSMCIAEDGEEAWKDILLPDGQSSALQAALSCEAGKLALLSAVAISVPAVRLQQTAVDGKPAYVALTQHILAIGERCSSDAAFTLGVARSILHIAKALAVVSDSALGLAIVDSMLLFIWSHLEHYMDSVRHLAAQALACVVNYCSGLSDKGDDRALNSIFSALACLDKTRKSYYVAAAALARRVGARSVIAHLPRLPTELLDALPMQPVQACVSTALDTVLQSHASAGRGEGSVWIEPILSRAASSEDATVLGVLENMLVTLLRADESLLDHLMPHIRPADAQTSRYSGDLKCVLMLLNVVRKSGALPLSHLLCEHESEWKGMIAYDVLKRAAVDAVDETRILALSLVVESQKSTEPFSPGDLDFIMYYLKYNINTQSPNFRQLTLSYIKKFVQRFDDSYKVMRRCKEERVSERGDYYLVFVESLRQLLFDSLMQGSNYSRRFVALQTLVWCEQLQLEGYSRVWKEDYVEKLLLHLEDTYESNKAYALDLLEKCPANILQGKKYCISLDVEDILRQASLVKPTECTSAAYKLKLVKRKLPHLVLEEQKCAVPEAATYCLLRVMLKRLQQEICQAEISILVAAARAPMYGLLHCITHLMKELDAEAISRSKEWSALVRELMASCRAAAAAAAPVVNNASPEGHLPMDRAPPALNGDAGDGSQVTAQMVLLCAWRTVKEVSLLLGEMSCRLTVQGEGPESAPRSNEVTLNPEQGLKISSGSDEGTLTPQQGLKNCVGSNESPLTPEQGHNIIEGTLTPEQLLEVGQHLTSLLAETKHRGAFEQAYVGFTLLLTRLWRCRGVNLHGAPASWLNALLVSLPAAGTGAMPLACVTRRGAGLPFMIQALVTTELQVSGNPRCFHHCMSTLLQLARFDPDKQSTAHVETRTHSLNILRALYRNTTLGESAASYVGDGLMTAISGFDAPTWPERNSSTLLFSALAVRVFGVTRRRSAALCSRNKMTGRVFFLRYPKLYDFMLNKLQKASVCAESQQLQPSLYPVLLVLARLYPSALEGTVSNLKLVAFIPYVSACAHSAVLNTRRLAARAAVPLLAPEQLTAHLTHLLTEAANRSVSRNYCHGILLQIVKLLEVKPESLLLDHEATISLSRCVTDTLWILEQAASKVACYVLADEYVKVINFILWQFPAMITDTTLNRIDTVLHTLLLSDDTGSPITAGKEVFLSNALYLYFIILYKRSTTNTAQLIVRTLLHKSYEVVLTSLNYLLIVYQECDGENFCCFQEHLDAITDREEQLHLLRNDPSYLPNLCHVLNSSGYLECVQKSLKVLSLERDTQKMIIGSQHKANVSNEEVVSELLQRLETVHENVTHIYLDSLLKFVSDKLQRISKGNLLDIVRIVYASSSSENGEAVRAVAVDFLERNYREMLHMNLAAFSGEEAFEYRSTVWSTIVTLLEDDKHALRQRISDIVSELTLKESNGAKNRIIPSKSAELLRELVGEYFESTEERIAFTVVMALLDFKSEVCLTDDGNDEARVFDQNERYNIFLEENIWANDCARKIRLSCPDASAVDYVKHVVSRDKYRKVIIKLCNNNFKVFEDLLANDKCTEVLSNNDALNPKIALFVSELKL